MSIVDVRIEGISKEFGRAPSSITALDGIELRVAGGEFVAVVGPSGCGKSTLLQILAGLIAPSRGHVLIDGRAMSGPGMGKAMVFQEYALFPWRTVIGNVRYALEGRGFPRRERRGRCMEYLALVGLDAFAHSYPAQLSGGMKQRVALARALVAQPDILLLDEPFAAVDAITRRELQQLLGDIIRETEVTTVLVTHSIDEAVLLANRVAVLSSRPGRVLRVMDVPGRPGSRDVHDHPYVELHRSIWHTLEAELRAYRPAVREHAA